jgi:hypothetical protein
MRVWVVQLETVDGAGWTSVHATAAAARQRLQEKVAAWGLGHTESALVRSYAVCEYEVEP